MSLSSFHEAVGVYLVAVCIAHVRWMVPGVEFCFCCSFLFRFDDGAKQIRPSVVRLSTNLDEIVNAQFLCCLIGFRLAIAYR